MNKIVRILNRRNFKKEADCYDRPNRRRLHDEYYVQWHDEAPSWETLEKLLNMTGGKEHVKQFEKKIRTYHKCYHLGNGRKPILITAMGNHCGYDIFVCMFLGYDELAPVLAETIYEYCPDLAIHFFEENLKIKQFKAVIEIPLRMQKKTALVYNKFILQLNPDSIKDSSINEQFNNNVDVGDDDDVDDEDIYSEDDYGSVNFGNITDMVSYKHRNYLEEFWDEKAYEDTYARYVTIFPKDFRFRQKFLLNHVIPIDEVD